MNEVTSKAFPHIQSDVEAGLLAAVAGNLEHWLQVRTFSDQDFVAHRDVFLFIGQYLEQYSNLPSSSLLSTRFSWSPPIGDFPYWHQEMKKYSLARRVLEVIQEGYNKITQPDAALALMVEKLSLIRSGETNHIQATDSSALERLEKFDYRTEHILNSKEIIGLRTGHKVIDNTLIGWTPGSMVGVFARPGVGKTWWLIWQGVMAWMDGKTVLLISPEMPANMLNLRIDLVIAAELGKTIDYNKLMVGDPSIRDNYKLTTEVMAQTQRWWTYDSINDDKASIGDIAALIRQHNPDVVLIDGISLLRSDSRGQTWEQMKDVCYGIKNLATIYEVPILVTHQAVNSNRGRRGGPQDSIGGSDTSHGDDWHMPNLNDAAFGDAFAQACSDVITFVGEQTIPYLNWYRIAKHRERGWQQPLAVRMGWACDFATGRFYDIGNLGYDPAAVGQEARRLLGK